MLYFTILMHFLVAGTGKTLLARAVASQLDCNFLKVVFDFFFLNIYEYTAKKTKCVFHIVFDILEHLTHGLYSDHAFYHHH